MGTTYYFHCRICGHRLNRSASPQCRLCGGIGERAKERASDKYEPSSDNPLVFIIISVAIISLFGFIIWRFFMWG